jgi:hypothetical protein
MRAKPIFLSACIIKPEDAWDLVHYLCMLRVTRKSPELVVWLTSKGGVEIVNAQKEDGRDTNGVRYQTII